MADHTTKNPSWDYSNQSVTVVGTNVSPSIIGAVTGLIAGRYDIVVNSLYSASIVIPVSFSYTIHDGGSSISPAQYFFDPREVDFSEGTATVEHIHSFSISTGNTGSIDLLNQVAGITTIITVMRVG